MTDLSLTFRNIPEDSRFGIFDKRDPKVKQFSWEIVNKNLERIENDTDKLRIMNRLAKIDHASKPEAKNVAKQEIRRVFSAKQGENYWTSLDSKLSNDLTEAVEDEETDGRVDE